jgi:hypothetical protein
MSELSLKQLVSNGKATIIYIHGTARSGSTIAEIVFSQLSDRAIHQPFRGILQNRGGCFRQGKLPFDADIYEAGCELIVEHILDILKHKKHATILVKELAGFFKLPLWERWIEIPAKFLFTIREPHLQYMSWLSAMTDKVFQGQGKLQENREFVLEKAHIIENSILPAEWEGTTISCNKNAWQALINDFNEVCSHIDKTSKKLAILDCVLLRKEPNYAISRTLKQLGFELDDSKHLEQDFYQHSQQQIFDIRDINRPMVRKARRSNSIHPLVAGENINLDLLPVKSQQHIWQIIPLYLNLLFASEHASMPSLEQLNKPVTGSATLTLTETHPFLTYAIAQFYCHQESKKVPKNIFELSLNNQADYLEKYQEQINSKTLKKSCEIVDYYCHHFSNNQSKYLAYQTI